MQSYGRRYVATVLVDANGPIVVYRKTHLGADEKGSFWSGPGPHAICLDGWRIGLGICRDTGIGKNLSGTAQLGVDLYAWGVVHHDWELVEQERRARHIAAICRAPVAMASFAGSTGEGFLTTAGHSAIWSATSTLIARAGNGPAEIASATLPRVPSLPTEELSRHAGADQSGSWPKWRGGAEGRDSGDPVSPHSLVTPQDKSNVHCSQYSFDLVPPSGPRQYTDRAPRDIP
ncbi:hypothetical protein MSAR_47220 [Mycolicibacterium sarraceniae]|uniref:CN hydrolase domain-containing protein n=1 Tax=Mycolicibacterium sarraceniae TaxID=1534348 RepID=A0A7I7T0J6_9MYCO|nr:hypothetical protein MSAR_47220 [Mycolicibacterium sarraceniae]